MIKAPIECQCYSVFDFRQVRQVILGLVKEKNWLIHDMATVKSVYPSVERRIILT